MPLGNALIWLGSATWACCTPCHEDELNERSLMPPVSVTMHAFGAEDVVEGEVVLLEPPPALLVLLPHAAASSATALNATAVFMVPLTVTSFCPGQLPRAPHA